MKKKRTPGAPRKYGEAKTVNTSITIPGDLHILLKNRDIPVSQSIAEILYLYFFGEDHLDKIANDEKVNQAFVEKSTQQKLG